MEAKTVSVIIPVYNVEQYLARCVDSILCQTYSKLEILLVDDGSPDGSGAICDAYAAKDARVRVIHKPNGGLSSARNAGIDASHGDYLSFIDSDDWIHPDTYRHLLDLMERMDASIACMGNLDVSERTGKITPALCPQKEECITGEELVRRMFRWQGIDCAACDKVFRAELFADIRFPMNVVAEDTAIMYQVALKAPRAAMCDQPFYYYYHRYSSISYNAVSPKSFHYSQHTQKILAHIEKDYPGLLPEAKYLRTRSLAYNLLTLDLAGAEERKTYRNEYTASRKALWRYLPFMWRCGFFTKKELATNTLLALGLYRPLRPLVHRKKV